MWIFLVLFYGICKGVREIGKKEALKTCSTFEVLLVYSAISFLLISPCFPQALGLAPKYYGLIAIKSFMIFVAWILGFVAIKKLPISLYGVLDLSRVLFASFLGVSVLHEKMNCFQIIGLAFVCIGLISLKIKFKERKAKTCEKDLTDEKESSGKNISVKTVSAFYVIVAFISCALNGGSGLLDKILMGEINSSQLQFWYMLFIVIFYLIYTAVTRTPIRVKHTLCNKWVWLISILFVISDRALFIANGMSGSRITVMTLIKQSGCLVTIAAGKFIYKEKGILHKAICAAIIIAGILLGVIWK